MSKPTEFWLLETSTKLCGRVGFGSVGVGSRLAKQLVENVVWDGVSHVAYAAAD